MWNGRICIRGILAIVMVAGAVAHAEEPAAPPPAEERIAVQAWGAAHPECAEWTDRCTICARVPDGIACSTPGVACLPQAVICGRPVPPPASAPAPEPVPEAKP